VPAQWDTRVDRRTFIKAGLAGGAALGAGAGIWAATQGGPPSERRAHSRRERGRTRSGKLALSVRISAALRAVAAQGKAELD